jgi:dihydrofolate reductase
VDHSWSSVPGVGVRLGQIISGSSVSRHRFLFGRDRVYSNMTTTDHPKLTQSVLVSLNGVTSEPVQWAAPFFGAGSAARSLSALEPVEAMLMGRHTYEIFSEQWPRTDGPYAERLNQIRKYVFSSTLTDPTWDNTVVIDGDVVEEVMRLMAAATGELAVYGHGRFGQTLCDAGLVDELTLIVVPVFVADGSPMFRPGVSSTWRLIGVGEGPDAGLAVLTYVPER